MDSQLSFQSALLRTNIDPSFDRLKNIQACNKALLQEKTPLGKPLKLFSYQQNTTVAFEIPRGKESESNAGVPKTPPPVSTASFSFSTPVTTNSFPFTLRNSMLDTASSLTQSGALASNAKKSYDTSFLDDTSFLSSTRPSSTNYSHLFSAQHLMNPPLTQSNEKDYSQRQLVCSTSEISDFIRNNESLLVDYHWDKLRQEVARQPFKYKQFEKIDNFQKCFGNEANMENLGYFLLWLAVYTHKNPLSADEAETLGIGVTGMILKNPMKKPSQKKPLLVDFLDNMCIPMGHNKLLHMKQTPIKILWVLNELYFNTNKKEELLVFLCNAPLGCVMLLTLCMAKYNWISGVNVNVASFESQIAGFLKVKDLSDKVLKSISFDMQRFIEKIEQEVINQFLNDLSKATDIQRNFAVQFMNQTSRIGEGWTIEEGLRNVAKWHVEITSLESSQLVRKF